ncbi:DnaJ-domain-containing protein [Phanerochaete sordida]|uniref:DnaJ-domain-containing protein n=1 Tax=Phanerochaete sordida TaxID=48140 RepID=A0A9P3FXK1_9APHY|nr:DnaJ-domain-containing protein [Phanerochaete sordida]
MRPFLVIAWLALLVAAVAAWTKEDYEIFDLVSALEGAEGKGTTFYSWLDVSPTASTSEIARAYRKKSVQLHPDKNPGVKGAHDRFARLGVVSKILRDPEARKRYDFFFKNGVPKWRGTGYYYSRFRPGLGTVFVFLAFVTSVLQYVVHALNYKRDLRRVDEVIAQAKTAAWGNKLTPGEGQRKVKVNLGGAPRVDGDGNLVPGRMVDMVVDGSDVFILDEDGNMLPVDNSTAVPPSVRRTWPAVLAASLYAKIVGSRKDVDQDDNEESEDGSGTASDAPGSGTVTPKGRRTRAANGAAAATSMAGGRRRKVVRKK